MKQQIAVYLPDTVYGERFVKYLKQIPQVTHEICYFNNAEACTQFLRKQKIAVLILKEQKEFGEVLKQAESIILISEHAKEREEELSRIQDLEFKIFYQYQSMEQLIPLIWPNQAKNTQQKLQTKENQGKISVISIITMESIEKGFFVVFSAAECRKQKGKTILLDCTQFSPVSDMAAKQQEGNMGSGLSDIIYYLKEEDGLTPDRIKKLIHQKKGIDTIYPVNHCLDLYELRSEHILQLLDALEESGYQTVISAVSVLTESTVELLKESKAILYAYSKDSSSSLRNKVVGQLSQVLPKECMERYREFGICEEKEMANLLYKQFEMIEEV